MTTDREQPACRADITAADLRNEASRAVLYGAVLAAQRPHVRLKPAIAAPAYALVPAVRAYLAGAQDDLAQQALEYARSCGAEAFLLQKRAAAAEAVS